MPTPYIKLGEMVRGDGVVIEATVVDGNGALLNLDNSTLWFTAKMAADSDETDSAAIIKKTTGAGIELLPQIGLSVGRCHILIDSDDTYDFANEKVKVLYDLQYQEIGVDPVTVALGDFIVRPDFTRRVTLP